MIAVENGAATVGVSLQTAESLDGEWTPVATASAEVAEDGSIAVGVKADSKAAFYKFVVPTKQAESTP